VEKYHIVGFKKECFVWTKTIGIKMDKNHFTDLKDKIIRQVEKIRDREYVGDAGAGMVKVTVTADLHVTKVEIDHTVFGETAPKIIDNLDFLADLFKAAINQAIDKSNEDLQNLGFQSVQF
jgi:DNA-binding protein YbaB